MAIIERLLEPDVIWVVIPIFAIFVGGAIAIVSSIISHRERIAMIEQGMHPDAEK